MVYELNGRKIICIFGNVTILKIILRNEFPGNNGLFKVQVPKIKYGYEINKKRPIFKNLCEQ